MDKENVTDIHNGLLEGNSAIYSNMDELRGRQKKTNTVQWHSHVESKNIELIETESRAVMARGRGTWEMVVEGSELSDERRTRSGDLGQSHRGDYCQQHSTHP